MEDDYIHMSSQDRRKPINIFHKIIFWNTANIFQNF